VAKAPQFSANNCRDSANLLHIRGLHQMNRGAAVEGVAGMGVAHPMRRDLLFQAGFPGGRINDAPDLRSALPDLRAVYAFAAARRRRVAQMTRANEPLNINPTVPGSGTAEMVNVSLVVAEYVFETLPLLANWARTLWNGTENCDVKFPTQVAELSAVTPPKTKVAVACGPAAGGLLTKLNGPAAPPAAGVQLCPTAGAPPHVAVL